MKIGIKALLIISMMLIHGRYLHILLKKETNIKKMKNDKKKNRKTLDVSYDSNLKDLDKTGSVGGVAVNNAVMMTLLSIFVANMLVNKPAGLKRRKLKESNILDSIMQGNDMGPILVEQKSEIKKFFKKSGIKITDDSKFKDLWPVCKRYCQEKYGLDNESFNLIKPMIKKFFEKIATDKATRKEFMDDDDQSDNKNKKETKKTR